MPPTRQPEVIEWTLPSPMMAADEAPIIYDSGLGGALYVAYSYLTGKRVESGEVFLPSSHTIPETQAAIIRFNAPLHYRYGHPNDEAIQGHALYEYGLRPYGFFEVRNSPLIQEIEMRNRVHPHHSMLKWEKWNHWIATFPEGVLEVIALDASFHPVPFTDPIEGLFSFVNELEPKMKVASDERKFFDSLEPNVPHEMCKIEGCSAERISLSVLCKRHHFEAVVRKPCPF